MKLQTRNQVILAAWAAAGMSAVWYTYTVISEKRKRKAIDRWLEAEREGIEIERKEKGL